MMDFVSRLQELFGTLATVVAGSVNALPTQLFACETLARTVMHPRLVLRVFYSPVAAAVTDSPAEDQNECHRKRRHPRPEPP